MTDNGANRSLLFCIYILQSEDTGRYYIGSTKNMKQRLARHNAGMVRSTKSFIPWRLVHLESFGSLAQARTREREIKSWKSRPYMEKVLSLKATQEDSGL